MFDIHFMRTDRLNSDLYDFLLSQGYHKDSLDFILKKKRIRPTELEFKTRPDYNWKNYYTPALKDLVLAKDKLLFSIFPDFNFEDQPE